MSVTIAAIAGTTGLGTERQMVATASGDLWAFGFTGTTTLASWYSQDGGQTWNAGATLTLASAHLGEGRNLGVVYRQVGTTDVVHIGIVYKSGTSLGARSVRATIASTTLTFHSSVTSVAAPTSDGGSLYWAGIGIELTSDNKVHFVCGYADGGNGDGNSSDSTADAGTAEQMTPVTWASHNIFSDNANEVRSGCAIDTGSGTLGAVVDDGSGISTTTGLNWLTWNGSAWGAAASADHDVTGDISAIDKNDWGAVAITPTDIHAVYREASTGALIHRRYDGSVWFDGQAIPSQTSSAGGGIAMMTDGACVWLGIIDTDGSNTVRALRWTPVSHNGVVDQWESAWSAIESSSATRTFLGCCRDVANQVGVFYWTEGSNLVCAPFTAISPPDPAGSFVQIVQGSKSTSGTTFPLTVVTQNLVTGDSIIVGVAVWNATAQTITGIGDTAGNTYVKDKDAILSDGTHGSIWRARVLFGGGTKPTITATASGAATEWMMFCAEWAGLLFDPSNYTDGSNSKIITVSASPVTSNPSTPVPAASGQVAIGLYFDGGNGITTIAPSAGWTQRGTSIQNTSITAEGCMIDQFTTAGTGSNASFTISSTGSPAGALVVVYKLAVSGVPPYRQVFPMISGLKL